MNFTMNKMIFTILILTINIISVFSDTGDTCGPVSNGMRDSNVCCEEGCTQCGNEFCSFEHDDNGNFVGSSEVSFKCCKSYIRKESTKCYECDSDGYDNNGNCVGNCNTLVNQLPRIFCNDTNSSPCIISHDDMILYEYKYENDGSSSNSHTLSTTSILWIVIGGILFLTLVCTITGFVFYKCGQDSIEESQNDIEKDIENDIEKLVVVS